LIVGVGKAKNPQWKSIFGLAVLIWAGFMFSMAGLLHSFQLNSDYSHAAYNLLDAVVQKIDAGHGDQVSQKLTKMRDELEVTYEHRGNFKELAEQTNAELKSMGDGSKSDKVPSEPDSK
jgi:hypothetical protein